MRFIGNKTKIVPKIELVLSKRGIVGKSFFDFFAGTCSVGIYFKKLNYKIISSDLLYFSYCLQHAYLRNNVEPKFKKVMSYLKGEKKRLFDSPIDLVVEYLNELPPMKGFIYQNYSPCSNHPSMTPRMYFTSENAMMIDSIRLKIEEMLKCRMINQTEYFILLSCLIESVPFYANISGVYAAYNKVWDPRAKKRFMLKSVQLIYNDEKNKVHNIDSMNLLQKYDVDILYLDPPYNHRQYAPNYHLLETISKYDSPEIKGIAGLRSYSNQKSIFCNASTAIVALDRIIRLGKYKHLVMSYNNEGIIPQEKLFKLFEESGKFDFVEFDNVRYKSNNNGESKLKKHVKEQLFILSKAN